ncbi:MAG: histidine kinase [Planctomycetia bacterium]
MSDQARLWKIIPMEMVSLDDTETPGWVWELRFWIGQLVFWGTLLLAQFLLLLPKFAPEASSLERWMAILVRHAVSVPMSLCLRRAFRYLSTRPWGLARKISVGAVCIVAAAVIDTLVFQWVLYKFFASLAVLYRGDYVQAYLVLFFRLMIYVVWSLLYVGFILRNQLRSADLRIERAEASLRQSELSRLQTQLQPHFLFNALTCILACRNDPDAVEKVTVGLSEHLRFCMQPQTGFSPLSRELTALERYLDVERMRFRERLSCQVSCTPEARIALVPPLILSPLLENALKHGQRTCGDSRLEIEVDCRTVDRELIISVRNSGSWIQPEQSGRRGLGLENLKGRMRLLRIPGFSLEYSHVDHFVTACIRLSLDAEAAQFRRV